jgi:hypothetical protein
MSFLAHGHTNYPHGLKNPFETQHFGWLRRVPIHVIIPLFFVWTSAKTSAADYRLKAYDYPRIEGASWLYDYDANIPHQRPVLEFAHVTLNEVNSKLEMIREKPLPVGAELYMQKASCFVEDLGQWNEKGSDADIMYVYERTCSYRGVQRGTCYHYGTDRIQLNATMKRVTLDRLDRGLQLPVALRVGETFSSTAGYYYRGRYRGLMRYSVSLVSHGALKVPYGVLNDCIRLRFRIQLGSATFGADEWWAKGIGMVKTQTMALPNMRPIVYKLRGLRLKGDRPARPQDIVLSHPRLDLGHEFKDESIHHLLDLLTLDRSASPVRQSLTIKNDGDGTLSGIAVKLKSKYQLPYKLTRQPNAKLKPGKSTTFEFEFDPSKVSQDHQLTTESCLFEVTSDDPNEKSKIIFITAKVHNSN